MKRLAVSALAMMLLATACIGNADTSDSSGVDDVVDLDGRVSLAAALTAFDACEDYLKHVQENALEVVGPWGLGQFGGIITFEGAVDLQASDDVAATERVTTPTAVGARTPGVDFSTTNVQEVGVDEPDVIKTDGRRIVAVARGHLQLINATGVDPVLTATLELGEFWTQEMFLVGDRVLLLSHASGPGLTRVVPIGGQFGSYSPVSTLIEVDISNPSAPRIESRLHLDGSQLSARMVGDVVRIVVQSGPVGMEWEFPEGGGLRSERSALEANREIIRSSTEENWLPYYVLENGGGRTIAEGQLVSCDRAYHPVEFSGLNMLNVITVDLGSSGLRGPIDGVGVLADGQTVYSSSENLYVGTTQWVDWEEPQSGDEDGEEAPGVTTAIHKFDISDPASTVYEASGTVIGTVLNQYSMSEHDGALRIATTEADPFGRGESESFVSILRQEGSELEQVGQVGGLGRGERIFAVRFMGAIATVVTFRQTDPLYTLDLSDPADPRTLGELTILGYSAYLHPLGDGLVLGVGQDATDEGRTLGTQVSLFDISDPSNPTRLDQWTLPGGWTEAEWNARAFLYWAPEQLVVLPVNMWDWENNGADAFLGAVALGVEENRLTERARLTHGDSAKQVCEEWVKIDKDGEEITHEECWVQHDSQSSISRSLVIGDVLYTLSEKGLLASDLKTLEDLSLLTF
jgi:hypothetical protein